MISIAICDSEKPMADQIENAIYEISNREKIAVEIDTFPDLQALTRELVSGLRYDILYLDIGLANNEEPGVIDNIRRSDENMFIVLVSEEPYYSSQLIELEALAVKKPLDYESFTNVFLQLCQKLSIKSHYFIFQYKNIYYKIPYKEILYFESRERKIHVITQYGTTEIFNGKLSEVEVRVARGSTPFVRIHQ